MSSIALTALALVLVAAVVGAWALLVFNALVGLRNDIDRATANIDVLLRQRGAEIPRLVEVCRGYMRHEAATLEAAIRARGGVGETGVETALATLLARAEQNPTLRADGLFHQLSTRITTLENEIADRREVRNATLVRYNTRLQTLPDAWVGRAAGLAPRPGLDVGRP